MEGTFSLTVRFSGLCHFISQHGLGARRGDMTIVFPNSGESSRDLPEELEALDGRKLERHVPYMLFDPRNLAPSAKNQIPSPMKAAWYFRHYRVHFEFISNQRDELSWPYDESIGDLWRSRLLRDDTGRSKQNGRDMAAVTSNSDMAYLAPLRKICGSYFSLNPHALKLKQPMCPVVNAQILLKQGKLRTLINEEVSYWKCSKVLCGKSLRRPLAWAVDWTVSGLKKLFIAGEPLQFEDPRIPSPSPTRFELRPYEDNSIFIEIGAYSTRNQLGWEVWKGAERDEDFRWYYELFAEKQKEDIRKKLKWLLYTQSLPVPSPFEFPKGGPSGNIRGVNCLPSGS